MAELPNIGFFAQPGVQTRRAARLREKLEAEAEQRERTAASSESAGGAAAAAAHTGADKLIEETPDMVIKRIRNGAQLCREAEKQSGGLTIAVLVDYLYRAIERYPDGLLASRSMTQAAATSKRRVGSDAVTFSEEMIEKVVSALGHLAMRPKEPKRPHPPIHALQPGAGLGRVMALQQLGSGPCSPIQSASSSGPSNPYSLGPRANSGGGGVGYRYAGGLHVEQAPSSALGGRHIRPLLDAHAVQAVSAVLAVFVRYRAIVLSSCWALEAMMSASYEARKVFLRDPECAGYAREDARKGLKPGRKDKDAAAEATAAAAAAVDGDESKAGDDATADGAGPASVATVSSSSAPPPSSLSASGPGLVLRRGPQPLTSSASATAAEKRAAIRALGRDGRDLIHDVQVSYSLALTRAWEEEDAERKAAARREQQAAVAAVTAAAVAAEAEAEGAKASASVSGSSSASTKPSTASTFRGWGTVSRKAKATKIFPSAAAAAIPHHIVNSSRVDAADGGGGDVDGDASSDDDNEASGHPPLPARPIPDAAVMAATSAVHQLLAMASVPLTLSPCIRCCVTGAGLPPGYVAWLTSQRERDKLQAWRRGASNVKVVPLDSDIGSWRANHRAALLAATGEGKEGGGDDGQQKEAGGGNAEGLKGDNGGSPLNVYKGRRGSTSSIGTTTTTGVGKRLVVFNYRPTSEAREVYTGTLGLGINNSGSGEGGGGGVVQLMGNG